MFWKKRGPAEEPEFEVVVAPFDRHINLYPIAKEVIEYAPDPTGMTPLRLAELAKVAYYGAYVRVTEFPEGIDRNYVRTLIRKTIAWANWLDRGEQIAKSGLRYELRINGTPCPDAQHWAGQVVDGKDAFRLPLPDCWEDCSCSWASEWAMKLSRGEHLP